MNALAILLRVAVVFGLLGATLWMIKRGTGGMKLRRRETPLQVLSTAKLGKGASIAVVQIGTESYALGVTDHAVTLLAPATLPQEQELPALAAAPAPAAADTKPSFTAAFVANLKANFGLVLRRGRKTAAQPPAATPGTDLAVVAEPTFAELIAEINAANPDLSVDDEDVEAEISYEPTVIALPDVAPVTRPVVALDARLARRLGARLGTLPAPAGRISLPDVATDGSAALPAPRARARSNARTDAVRRNEEHPWITSCRTPGRVERFRRSPF